MVRTFVNVTMYSQYNNMIIKLKNKRQINHISLLTEEKSNTQ
jgi:hypothetical protein